MLGIPGAALYTDISGAINVRTVIGAYPYESKWDPTQYIVIRLTDGNNFYTAGGTTASVGTVAQGSPATMASAWPVKPTDGNVILGVQSSPVYVANLTASQLQVTPIVPAIKSVPITASLSGTNVVVAAVPGKRLKVFSFGIQVTSGTCGAKFTDGASADMTGRFAFNSREGLAFAVAPPAYLFGTSIGNALVLDMDSAVNFAGFVSYWDSDAT